MKKSQLRQLIREEIKNFLNEGVNLRKIEGELHRVYDFDGVESEGSNRLRFDYNNGRDHMWINDDGTVEGGVPKDNSVKKVIKKHKLTITRL